MEAYFARNRAINKGIKGFKGGKNKGKGTKHFDVFGYLSLIERQQRLQVLKSRTICRRCHHVGHWSGEPSCPKGSGRGKPSASPSTKVTRTPTNHSLRAALFTLQFKGKMIMMMMNNATLLNAIMQFLHRAVCKMVL